MEAYMYLPGNGYEGITCQDDPWPDSASMQRSSSQSSSASTLSSSYTASTYMTDYSSLGQLSPVEDLGCHDPAASLYQLPCSQPQDADHLLLATGSQYQISDQQHLPQALQLCTPYQLFTHLVPSIEAAARQATDHASLMIQSQGSYLLSGLLVVTCDVVDEALWTLQDQGQDSSPRAAVQDVLYRHLYRQFKDGEQFQEDPSRTLREAAYQLQLRLQGPKVPEICYYALLAVLAKLAEDLRAEPTEEEVAGVKAVAAEEEEVEEPTTVPGSPDDAFFDPSQLPTTEKERYPCLIPGCKQKGFSRSADLDRHYKMVHLGEEHKKKYACDYKKCARHDAPFFRQDHFRDHLRLFHKEDLLKRGSGAPDRSWWESRSPRAMFAGWWRCNRCLVVRVDYERHGFVCPGCGNPCEAERQKYRMAAAAQAARGGGRK